ncbi:MAG TPA: NAD(P)-dependent oxidoreductase [Bacteroidia bacterium]|jgi:UDP-glucose 4-epimerase|nr:NAD(P)-dependent oxidoreductase [Bacteroidia bacterium]
MNIVVTGVAGFIGSNLLVKLLEAGHTVTGVDNLSYGNIDNIKPFLNHKSFEFKHGDIANPLMLKDIKADVVVHLASQKIPRYDNALRTLDENYLMLRNVVQKCLLDKAKIVFASTSDVYGKNIKPPFSEESDLVMGPTTIKRWAYALSKIYGEQYIIANNAQYNMDYTIMRFFGSYGPNQNTTWWGGPQSVFIQNIIEGKPIELHGDGLQTRTFTYVDDTVQGIMKCIFHENAKNDIFNIANEPKEEVTIKALAELICNLMRDRYKSPEVKCIPYSTFGKYEDVARRVPDITKIKEKLQYVPKFPLEEGLKKAIDWQINRSK